MLDEGSHRHLLAVARDAIARLLALPSSRPESPPHLTAERPRPVFVTLTVDGKLRGCVGHLDPAGTLEECVASCALSSATADPRFSPLRPDEFPQLRLEISLLSPPVLAAGPQDVVVGRHGIIVSQGGRRGLLLPQVATEHGWTPETFLSQASLKAGLRPDAWRAGARIHLFTAEVFGEP